MKATGFVMAALILGGAVSAMAQTYRVHATLDRIDGNTLQATTAGGAAITLTLASTTRYSVVESASLSDVKPDTYVGCGAITLPGGRMQALEVHIFPPDLRGAGEGSRPWDAGPQSTMTNGAVGTVTGVIEHTISIVYKGGAQKIIVPPGTPIVKLMAGSRSMLVPGGHVSILVDKAADQTLTARYVVIGKDGLVPPM
jgi:hypothetical protein